MIDSQWYISEAVMSKMPENVLWKASDGREFRIEVKKLGLKSMEEVYDHIAELRKKHGYETPTFVHAVAKPGIDLGPSTDVSELPDHLREEVEKTIKEGWEQPDPKKMN
jgi:hypothetical protein